LPEHIGLTWTRNIVDLEPGISIGSDEQRTGRNAALNRSIETFSLYFSRC